MAGGKSTVRRTVLKSLSVCIAVAGIAVFGLGCGSSELSEHVANLFGGNGPAWRLVKEAHAATEAQEYDKAIALCTKAIDIDPSYAYAYGLRASCYSTKGNYELAFSDCNSSIAFDPYDAHPYRLRARILFEREDYTNAIRDCACVIDMESGDAYAYGLRATCYAEIGDNALALADCERALEQNPNSREIVATQANLLFDSGDYADAIGVCTSAIDRGMDEAYFVGLRGTFHLRHGVKDEAISDLTRSIELLPDAKHAYLWRGRAHLDAGNFDAALSDADAAAELPPKDENADLLRTSILLDSGRTSAAMKLFDRMLTDYPDSIALLNAKAYTLCTVPESIHRDGEEAVRLAEKALKLSSDPDRPAYIVDTLACAYAETGQFDKAIALQREALASCPAEIDIQKHLTAFEAGKPWREEPKKSARSDHRL